MSSLKQISFLLIVQGLAVPTFSDWIRTNFDSTLGVVKIASYGPKVFAAVGTATYPNGLYASTDNGMNWTPVPVWPAFSVDVIGGIVYVGGARVLFSLDSGRSWSRLGDSTRNANQAIAFSGNGMELFAANQNQVFHFNAGSNSWDSVGLGPGSFHTDMVFADSLLYVSDLNSGVFVSSWPSQGWKLLRPTGPVLSSSSSLLRKDSILFSGMGNSGVHMLRTGDTIWQPMNNGLPLPSSVQGLENSGSSLFVGLTPQGVYRSSDGGRNWQVVNQGLVRTDVDILGISDAYIFAKIIGGNGRGLWQRPLSDFVVGIKYLESRVQEKSIFVTKLSNGGYIFRYFLSEPAILRLMTYEYSGRKSEFVQFGPGAKGWNESLWTPLREQTSKTYILEVRGSGSHFTKTGLFSNR